MIDKEYFCPVEIVNLQRTRPWSAQISQAENYSKLFPSESEDIISISEKKSRYVSHYDHISHIGIIILLCLKIIMGEKLRVT